jgi:hypothetical protein
MPDMERVRQRSSVSSAGYSGSGAAPSESLCAEEYGVAVAAETLG